MTQNGKSNYAAAYTLGNSGGYGPWFASSSEIANEVTNVGRTLTNYRSVDSERYLQKRTKTSVQQTSKNRGSLIGEIISNNSSLSTNGVSGSNWYVRKTQAKPYYLHKYIDNEIQTTYDVQTAQINTKRIDLTQPIETVKILVNSNNTNYQISISKDSENWIQIEDKTQLNGESEIELPEAWSNMYIKIERNGSTINQIVVK